MSFCNNLQFDKGNEDDKLDIRHFSRNSSVKPLRNTVNTIIDAYVDVSKNLREICSIQFCKLLLQVPRWNWALYVRFVSAAPIRRIHLLIRHIRLLNTAYRLPDVAAELIFHRMDRVISNEYKEEPETLDLLVKDVNLLNCDTPLETVYDEFCQHGWGKNEEKESSDGG
ncbi:hypothetical protein Tco_0928593 [Tanacetum coccineum]